MKPVLQNRILTALVWISAILFVLGAILPGRPFWLAPRKLFYLCVTLSIVKGFWVWRRGIPSRYLELLPFLLLFLFSVFNFSRFPEYVFGVDDAYYYSYVRSAFLDFNLDLTNEYELSGLVKFLDEKTVEARTSTGYPPNVFPVGLSFFWSPFFLLGHLLAIIFGLPQTGFSRVYTHIVGAGNLLYACAGLYFCYRFCSLFFSRVLSLVLTAAALLTTPHLWLFFRSFMLTSEPLSLALIAIFLFIVSFIRKDASWWKWFLVGILLGAMTMVRLHNAILGIVPAIFLFLHHRADRARLLSLFVSLLGGALLGFVPQFIAWKILYGEWLFSRGGAFLPFWKNPFVLETLFSARKGLVPWSPVALIAMIGISFFLRKDRVWTWALIVVLIGTIWINSGQADWWGATSLGARRFVPMVPIFVVGLAALYSALPRIARGALLVVLVSLIVLNFFFVSSSRAGNLQAEHADRFSDILPAPYSLYKPIAYALQFPVQFAYSVRYGIPLYGPLNEFFIGEDVFYFQKRAGSEMLSKESPLFGSGWDWQGAEPKTNGALSIIHVPLFMKDKPRIVVELSFMPADEVKHVWVDFYWNGKFLRSRKIPVDGRQLDVPIRSREYRSDVNALSMRIYQSRTEDLAPALVLTNIYFRPPRNMEEMTEEKP